jgi:hypothetical protein
MGTRLSLAFLLGLGATIALLLGCGAAPAAQTAEPPSAVQKPMPDASVNDGSEAEVVEVGYQVGLRAPEFGMTLLDGSSVTTSSIVNEGKPVLLYFHATY